MFVREKRAGEISWLANGEIEILGVVFLGQWNSNHRMNIYIYINIYNMMYIYISYIYIYIQTLQRLSTVVSCQRCRPLWSTRDRSTAEVENFNVALVSRKHRGWVRNLGSFNGTHVGGGIKLDTNLWYFWWIFRKYQYIVWVIIKKKKWPLLCHWLFFCPLFFGCKIERCDFTWNPFEWDSSSISLIPNIHNNLLNEQKTPKICLQKKGLTWPS